MGIEPRLQAGFPKGLPPGFHLELVAPAIKPRAQLPGPLNDGPQAAVTPRKHRLQQCLLVIVPIQLEPGPPQVLLEIVLLRADLFLIGQGQPLEGGVRLGHQGRDTDVHLRLAAQQPPTHRLHLPGQVHHGRHVLQRLRRMADHEIELDGLPAPPIHLLGHRQQVPVGDRLVDHPPQPLGGGLGGKGKAGAAPGGLQLFHQVHRNRLDAQAGQRDRQVPVAVAVYQRLHQRLDGMVVAGAEG